jgi:hypothetical protein
MWPAANSMTAAPSVQQPELADRLQDAAERAHAQAVNLAGKGEDAAGLERAALEAEEHARTLQKALDQARTAADITAGLFTRLDVQLHSEAEKVRAEVLARHAEGFRWLALATAGQELPAEARGKNLLREAVVADGLVRWVTIPTPAQRAQFGRHPDVGGLDQQLTDLMQVPGYQRPRGVNDNYKAPMSRTF